mmetsp:Transcript_12879/g.14525  ORF Transcript_12879/g.14525 Transcript_12879/m.14525 type:complete len:368 (+) Transcript_12879:235-1338(+)
MNVKSSQTKLTSISTRYFFLIVIFLLLGITSCNNENPDIYLYKGEAKSDIPSWVEHLVVDPSVTNIQSHAFSGFPQLKRVDLPYSISSIGENAFEDCENLRFVMVPLNATVSIKRYAFAGCTSLAYIYLDGIVSIGEGAFYGCVSLKVMHWQESPMVSIADRAFYGCTSFEHVHLPYSVTSDGEEAFMGCTGLKYIEFPDEFVAAIGERAFKGCTSLEQIYLPDSTTSIESGTFIDCTSLDFVKLPRYITYIGKEAFSGCTGLTSIKLPYSLQSFEDDAFNGCNNLKEICIAKSFSKQAKDVFPVDAELIHSYGERETYCIFAGPPQPFIPHWFVILIVGTILASVVAVISFFVWCYKNCSKNVEGE